MKDRFFFVLHCVAFFYLVPIGLMVSMNANPLDEDFWFNVWLLSYPSFLILDYIVNGKLIWFPWLRDK
jgi:hypothetical protein